MAPLSLCVAYVHALSMVEVQYTTMSPATFTVTVSYLDCGENSSYWWEVGTSAIRTKLHGAIAATHCIFCLLHYFKQHWGRV
mgnify:CR=1 FL=1